MFIYLAAFAGIQVLAIGLGALASLWLEELPDISKIVLIFGIGVAAYWFLVREQRTFTRAELWTFAAGIAILDAVIALVWMMILSVISTGSISGDGMMFGAGLDPTNPDERSALLFAFTFGTLFTLFVAALAAWGITRIVSKPAEVG